MPSTFEKDTHVTPADAAGTYEAVLDPSWWVFEGPNGGYLAASMVRALEGALPEAGPLRDLSVSFLEPADAGPARIEVTPVREGGSVTVARADLLQGGTPMATMRVTLGAAHEGPRFVASTMPKAASWQEGRPLDVADGVEPPTFTQHCEYRVAGGDPPLAGRVGGDMRAWMRMAEPTPMTTPLAVFLSDAWMAALFSVLEAPAPVPTLDLSVQIHQVPVEHGDDEPLLGVFKAEHATDGYAFEDGTLWTSEGALVARARQTRAVLG